MFKNISKNFKNISKNVKNISKIFQQISKISKNYKKKIKKNLAVPDQALLGFDYFPIYYLLIIAVPNSALLNIYI